jgi:LmbE family N-acetylglucosaminyl deacetylase
MTLPNRAIFDTVENRKAVASIIREIRPELLFVPYWEDAHPDHVQANALCEAARFYAKFSKTDMPHEPWYPRKMLCYFSTHLRVRISPSFIFDISAHLDTKMKSIQAYESQFVVHPKNAERIDVIRREAQYWGDQIGVAAGEPFLCRENVRIAEAAAIFAL